MVDANKLLRRKNNAEVFKKIDKATKPKLDISRLVSRRSDAKGDLDKWRSLLETAYHYAIPNYNPFENYGLGGQETPGQQYDSDVYDLTLHIAHQRLADKMLMGLAPQGQQWVKFKPGDLFGDPKSSSYVRALSETQRMTDNYFKIIDRSNFYTAFRESLDDVLVSTGNLVINEGTRRQPIKFEAGPPSHVLYSGNAEGGIDAVYRDWYDVRVSNIKHLWPNADLTKLNGKDAEQKINLWEISYIDYDAPEKERYKYVLMTDGKEVLLEESSSSWPWVIYRMRKMTGEVRGRGPSLGAWPTSSTINKAVEDELIAAAFTANPMYMAASDSVFNPDTFEPHPGIVIPVQMVMGNWPIEPLIAGGNIQFNALLVNDFRQQINDLLYAFPLGGVNGPEQTATESRIRYTENVESFSAMVPRLQNEFFSPTVTRSLWVINKVRPDTFGDMDPQIKDKMLSVDGDILDLAFETPLMTAKGEIKTKNLLTFYQELATLIGQEAASATLKPPEVVTSLAEDNNVDMSNIKTKEELEALTQAAGNAANQVMEQEGIDTNG